MTQRTLRDEIVFPSGLVAKNRVVLAPMTNKMSHRDGTLSDDELHFLLSRADGGFGVVTTCAAHVSREGQGWEGELGIWDDLHLPGLRRIADGLRARGAKSLVQIFHGGLRANEEASGLPRVAPSAASGATEASADEVRRLVSAFGDAALRARRAGFDGVEIHGAHGYLVGQFLSQVQNTRSDDWGGSFEGRSRFAREVVADVRKKVGRDFTVGYRLSPEDFGNAVGLDLDESLSLAETLAPSLDFVHLSLWRALEPTKKRPAEHALPLFRKVVPAAVPLFVAGTIWSRADAEHLLGLGADAVALGRSAIANPAWPLRVHDEGWEPRRPPFTPDELVERGLSPSFADYMRSWKGFVV